MFTLNQQAELNQEREGLNQKLNQLQAHELQVKQEKLSQHSMIEAGKAVHCCKSEISKITSSIPIFDLLVESGIAQPTDDTLAHPAIVFLGGIRELERVSIVSIKIVNPNTLLVLSNRNHWAGTGGTASFSQMRVYFHGQTSIEEWRYRHPYHESADNYRNCFDDIGEVTVTKNADANKVDIQVELVNDARYSNIHHVFSFEPPTETSVPAFKTISPESLESFKEKVEVERTRVLADLEKAWEYKPTMLADYGGITMPTGTPTYVKYQRPRVRAASVLPTGVASFITEEQIDHRTHIKQMRYELYIMKYGDEKARVVAEDHAYEHEKGAFVSVIALNPKEVVVNTSRGESTIEL